MKNAECFQNGPFMRFPHCLTLRIKLTFKSINWSYQLLSLTMQNSSLGKVSLNGWSQVLFVSVVSLNTNKYLSLLLPLCLPPYLCLLSLTTCLTLPTKALPTYLKSYNSLIFGQFVSQCNRRRSRNLYRSCFKFVL